jgi:hypothetical protein
LLHLLAQVARVGLLGCVIVIVDAPHVAVPVFRAVERVVVKSVVIDAPPAAVLLVFAPQAVEIAQGFVRLGGNVIPASLAAALRVRVAIPSRTSWTI